MFELGAAAAARRRDPALRVVASTDVWGNLVSTVAGDRAGDDVQVTSVIDDPNADPHSYEANARTQLAVSRADLIVENGGGYDDFMDRMRASAKTSAPVVNAVQISGKTGPDLNEHVWYDFPTVRAVVDRIAAELARLDPAHASTYRTNAHTLDVRIAALQRAEAAIRTADGGTGVAITEPVPLYMLTACGLVNRTPAAFSKAIEDDTDVPTRVLQDTLQLFGTGSGAKVALLVYNEQTTGVETRRVLDAARSNHVAVVPVTETLPAGRSYLGWMSANLAAIRAAL